MMTVINNIPNKYHFLTVPVPASILSQQLMALPEMQIENLISNINTLSDLLVPVPI